MGSLEDSGRRFESCHTDQFERERYIMGRHVRGILAKNRRQNRRKTIYKMTMKREGSVPCFVCHEHVELKNMSLEHIVPLSKGGTDEMGNLSISHVECNNKRGNS